MSLVLPEDPSDRRPRLTADKPAYRQVPALAKMKGIDIWRILTTDVAPSKTTDDDPSPAKLHLVTSQWVDDRNHKGGK